MSRAIKNIKATRHSVQRGLVKKARLRLLFNVLFCAGQVKTLSGHFHGLYLRLNISYRLNEVANASGWKVLYLIE